MSQPTSSRRRFLKTMGLSAAAEALQAAAGPQAGRRFEPTLRPVCASVL